MGKRAASQWPPRALGTTLQCGLWSVGIAVTLLDTGESALLCVETNTCRMQSVYKLPIAMATLDQVDRGLLKLEQPVRSGSARPRYIRSLGVGGIVVATTEKEVGRDEKAQYRNWASPNAMVSLVRALHAGRSLSPASRVLLRQWMTETSTGARRLKGLLPAGTVVAHKTGTSRTVNGLTAATMSGLSSC